MLAKSRALPQTMHNSLVRLVEPPMIDFAAARRMMVDGQIRTSDVTDLPLIAAMMDVPRERFVPHAKAALAYLDFDVPVTSDVREAEARHLLKPVVLAKMIQAAEVEEGDSVLDVGCATGYASAILARLARSVTALEQNPTLARHARENLEAMHQDNVTVVTGPLVDGWAAQGPYDVISAGRSHRGGGEGPLPSAQGGWAHGGGGRTDPERAGDPLSLRQRRRHRATDFRCLGSDAARVRRGAEFRVLRPRFQVFTRVYCGANTPRIF